MCVVGVLVMAGCGSTSAVTSGDSPATAGEEVVEAVQSESERFAVGQLSCPTDLSEDAEFDYSESPEQVTPENTAASTAAWFMSDANSTYTLRTDDWQLLALDPELSNERTFIYSDGDGNPYLQVSLTTINETWVVSSYTSCALVSDSGPNVTIAPAQ